MSTFDAAEFAERWADNQRGMAEVAAALRSIGSFDQAIAERRKALEKLAEEHAAKHAEKAEVEKALADIRASHVADVDTHETCLAQSTNSANSLAEAIIADARDQVAKLIEAAQHDMEVARAGHDAAMNDAAATAANEQAKADGFRNEIASMRAEHEMLVAKIEDMKTAARKALE